MLRHYSRLSVLLTIILFLLVIVSLNFLHTSHPRFGVVSEAHLQGEEVLGATLSKALGSQKDDTTTTEEPPHLVILHDNAKDEDIVNDDTVTPIAKEDAEIQPPERPQNGNGEPDIGSGGGMPPPPDDSPQPEEESKPEISKIIVMGRLSTEDTDWVAQEMTDWQNAIYTVDLPADIMSPTGYRTTMNKAKEAMPYLTYITDNYPDFPDVMAFIHSHRNGMPQAWHTDAREHDAVYMLQELRLETVLDRGYVNLRCNTEVGCPDEVQPFRDPPDEEKHAEHAFPEIYGSFFNLSMEQMREQIPIVATPCCAQFAVSREQVLARPKTDYLRYRKFLEETHHSDDVAGRVLEYMWHIIFGKDAVYCENMFECWCAVYGRCRSMPARRPPRHG